MSDQYLWSVQTTCQNNSTKLSKSSSIACSYHIFNSLSWDSNPFTLCSFSLCFVCFVCYLTDKSSIRTMSGLAWVVLMLVGIVAEGDSEALHVGISACRWAVVHSVYRMLERRQFRTESASICSDLEWALPGIHSRYGLTWGWESCIAGNSFLHIHACVQHFI